MSLARFAFQACSFSDSDISPILRIQRFGIPKSLLCGTSACTSRPSRHPDEDDPKKSTPAQAWNCVSSNDFAEKAPAKRTAAFSDKICERQLSPS